MRIVAALAGLAERVVSTLGFLRIIVPGGRRGGLRQHLGILGEVEGILGVGTVVAEARVATET